MNAASLDARPVFIVGAARSGTTWVQCVISAMEGFYSCPETHFFDELLPRGRVYGGYQLHRPRYRSLPSYIGEDHLAEIFEKCDRGFLRVSASARIALFAEAAAGRLKARTLAERLINECGTTEGNRRERWVEKTPVHVSYLEQVFALFPEAQVVFVVRDPEAVLNSAVRDFGVPVSIAAMDYWRSYRDVRRFLDRHPERRSDIFLVIYERLLNSDEELERLGTFLDARNFDPAKLRREAKRLFEEIYGSTALRRVQRGMRVSTEAMQGQPESAIVRLVILATARMLRQQARLVDLPLMNLEVLPSQRRRLATAFGIFRDLCCGVGYVAKWHTIGLAQQGAAWFRRTDLLRV